MDRGSAIAALLAALAAITTAPARAGEVQGQVRYAAAPAPPAPMPVTKDSRACGTSVPDESLLVSRGGLANVVVTLEGAPPAPPARARLDQQGCRFVPHVQVAPLGSTLEIANGDPVLHNVHGWLGRTTRFDVPMPERGVRAPVKLDRPGLIQVRCDVHGWMSAFVVVAAGPAAVSGADGVFALRDVPPGSYKLTAWHERLGVRTVEVTVPAQGATRVALSFVE